MPLKCEKSSASSDWNTQITSSYTGNILLGFSPLCWRLCDLKLLLFENIKSQKTQF